MDPQNREQTPEIINELIENSRSFSFVQAVRLLLHQCVRGSDEAATGKKILENHIRIRPELSLNFPGTDITGVDITRKNPDSPIRFLITATFLGLYGSSSPLPTFYTEDLIDEFNDDKSIKRDFMDIINYALYPIFFKIWSKHRLFYKICEEQDEQVIEMLYSLLGLEDKQARSRIKKIDRYFRYTGLSLQFPRSAEGLESIVSDGFDLKDRVQINQCVPRTVKIPEDQHALLGQSSCTLGEDAVIGRTVNDISGKFQIRIKDADSDTLHTFLPDRDAFVELRQLVEFYVNQPLDWELAVEVKENQIQTAQPGNSQWSHLGWNTWLMSDNQQTKYRYTDSKETTFSPYNKT